MLEKILEVESMPRERRIVFPCREQIMASQFFNLDKCIMLAPSLL